MPQLIRIFAEQYGKGANSACIYFLIMELLFKLLICHLIGDFTLQTSYLAKTKGENWYHLFVHCILYAVPFYICLGWCWQLGVITLLHFPIDALKARYHKITYLQDQALHYLLCLLYLL